MSSGRPIFEASLRFDVPLWRWSEDAALRRCEALTTRHLEGHRWAPHEFERFQLWDLAGQALRMRHQYRHQARALVGKIRYAWAVRDDRSSFEVYLMEAQHLIQMVALRPTLELAERTKAQRRAAARKHRSGPSDAELVAHRDAYIRAKGHDRGWPRRVFIELGMPERTLRDRMKKMRQ